MAENPGRPLWLSNWGTRWRLAAFLVVTLMFLTLSVTTLLLVRRTVAREGESHALNFTRAVARQVDAWLQQKREFLNQTASLSVAHQDDVSSLRRELRLLLQSDKDLLDVYLWRADGVTFTGSGWQPPTSLDARSRPWFITSPNVTAAMITDPYRDLHTGRITVTLSKPVLSAQGEFLGIAGVDLKLSAAARHVMFTNYQGGARVLILDRQGHVMVDSRYRHKEYPDELARLTDETTSRTLRKTVRGTEEGSFFGPAPGVDSRRNWLITHSRVPSTGWVVVSYVPRSELMGPFALFLRGWLLFAGAAIILILLAILFFFDRLLLPIERLLRLTRESRVMNTEAAATDDLLVLTRSVNRLMAYIDAFPGVLNLMLGLKDGYTSHHTREVARYSVAIGKALGLSERQLGELECAALLHDIGKAGVPDVILKKPGSLTDEEWVAIRLHPVIGAEVAAEAGFAPVITHAIRQHHERLDGSGYPDRSSGEAIGLYARIIAVADTYHAMTSDRPYRPARGALEAQTELCNQAGQKYDLRVVQAFLSVLADKPQDSPEEGESRISELSPA